MMMIIPSLVPGTKSSTITTTPAKNNNNSGKIDNNNNNNNNNNNDDIYPSIQYPRIHHLDPFRVVGKDHNDFITVDNQ